MALLLPPDRPAPPVAPLLLRALRGEEVPRPPVWFMRQAGRSLPEYRELRRGRRMLDLCGTPELAAEVTLQPVRRHGVDAAILFSDIVVPLEAVGVDVEIRPGVGPVIGTPVRTRADLARLREPEPDTDLAALAAAVRLSCDGLGDTPLIGFAGAPFTLASYLVEGGPSKAQARTRALMLAEPALWAELLERLAGIAAAAIETQVRAGAQAVQVFDSWVGSLSAEQYDRHVLPAMRVLMQRLSALGVPVIVFGLGTGHLLERLAATGADVVGVDWRTPLPEAAARLGPGIALQGNLDPAACLAPWDVCERHARAVLDSAPARGYVFNLGHGVQPQTDPGILTQLAAYVREQHA